jgi:hypothetical protein
MRVAYLIEFVECIGIASHNLQRGNHVQDSGATETYERFSSALLHACQSRLLTSLAVCVDEVNFEKYVRAVKVRTPTDTGAPYTIMRLVVLSPDFDNCSSH